MADPFATVLTHLTNLVSFRSSLRLLIISGSIICCWVFIAPKLTPLSLPSELSLTLITVIGFSFGALLFSAIFNTLDFTVNFIKDKLNAKKKLALLEKVKKEKRDNDLKNIELVKKSFNDYSVHARDILFKLNKNDCTIGMGSGFGPSYKDAINGLLDSGIVIVLHRLEKEAAFCTINPLYKDAINQSFDEKHRKEVAELLERNPDGLKSLIKKLQNKTNVERFVFNIPRITFINRFNYTPIIKTELYEEGEFIDNCNIQFYISERHYSFLSEKLGTDIREYILGFVKEENEQE